MHQLYCASCILRESADTTRIFPVSTEKMRVLSAHFFTVCWGAHTISALLLTQLLALPDVGVGEGAVVEAGLHLQPNLEGVEGLVVGVGLHVHHKVQVHPGDLAGGPEGEGGQAGGACAVEGKALGDGNTRDFEYLFFKGFQQLLVPTYWALFCVVLGV